MQPERIGPELLIAERVETEDRLAVSRLLPTTKYVVTANDVLSSTLNPETQIEFWWLLLLLVMGLLAFEVWMTRRIAGAK